LLLNQRATEPEWKRTFLVSLGLVIVLLLILSAYSNTLNSPAVLDDTHAFVDEPLVQRFDWSAASVLALSRSKFGWKRFIPMLTLANDSWRGKGHLASFHLTNILIHILTTLAVFFWARLLFRLARNNLDDESGGDELLASLAVASIWSLVPVQTNVVTYIVQRMAGLSALFYILSFTSYFYGRLQWLVQSRKRAVGLWFLSVLCCVAALMSKENAVTLPVMIVVGEELFFRRQFNAWLARHRKVVLVIVALVASIVFAVACKLMPTILAGYNIRHFTLVERLLTELRILVSYIHLLLFPSPAALCFDSHTAISTSLLEPISTLFSLLLILFLFYLAWFWRRRSPLISFGLVWFFCNLALESTFISLELKFEHRLYLPSCGFYIFLVGGGVLLTRYFVVNDKVQNIKFWAAALMILCAFLSLMTHVRNRTWTDVVTFYEDCVVKAPQKARVHSNLSKAYGRSGLYQKSIDEAEIAIKLGVINYEAYWVAACNMISAYSKQGLISEALERGKKLLANAPSGARINSKPIFLSNLAVLYARSGDYQNAYDSLHSAIDILTRSDLPYLPAIEQDMLAVLDDARMNGDDETLKQLGLFDREKISVMILMADLFFNFGEYSRAGNYVHQVLTLDGDNKEAKQFIAKLEAIERANRSQLLYGTLKQNYLENFWQSFFHFNMAVAYVIEKYHLPVDWLASGCLQRARYYRQTSPDPYLLDSWRYYCRQKYDRAICIVQKGLLLDKNYAQLWVNLGMYQLAAGQPRKAIISLKRAMELYPAYPRKQEVIAMLIAAKKESL